jgi:hypothetical protein
MTQEEKDEAARKVRREDEERKRQYQESYQATRQAEQKKAHETKRRDALYGGKPKLVEEHRLLRTQTFWAPWLFGGIVLNIICLVAGTLIYALNLNGASDAPQYVWALTCLVLANVLSIFMFSVIYWTTRPTFLAWLLVPIIGLHLFLVLGYSRSIAAYAVHLFHAAVMVAIYGRALRYRNKYQRAYWEFFADTRCCGAPKYSRYEHWNMFA